MKTSKHVSALAALCVAGAAMMVTACVKNDLSTSSDLQFTAESSIGTKAVYGGDSGEYQRIIWQGGDEVTIASDQAKTLWGRQFCDYIVTPESGDATAGTRQSKGRISRKPTVQDGSEDSGLRWDANASGTANFWSVYPATSDNAILSGTVKATIAATTSLSLSTTRQPGADIVKILDPVNGSYPMVAHGTASANNKLVKLQYYPAFTAFQITLFNNTDGQITLSSCSLSSSSSDLSGTFTASIDALALDAPSHPAISVTGAGKTVSVGIGEVLADGQGVTFSIFCLPQDLTDLTFNVKYFDANGEQDRQLRLDKDGSALSFEACKQHRLSLTLTRTGGLNYEITEVIKIVLANAFPDLFDYSPSYGEGYQLYHHGTGNRVTEEEIRAAVLNVRNVTISNDYGAQGLDYTVENGMCAFINLETLTLDNVHTIANISIDGLKHFTTFDMIYADNIHNISITNCPMTETVNVNSQSLATLNFENLASMKYLTINEGTANSNLQDLRINNCPDLEVVNLGLVGKLKTIDLHDCDKMTDLSIGLANELNDLDLSGCTALKNLYINQARNLETLNTDDCTSIESIVLTNPQSLVVFRSHSTTLKELRFISSPDDVWDRTGSQHLVTLELDTPALATLEFCNLQDLTNLSLSHLPASVNDFNIFTPVKDGTATSRSLSNISLTDCNGFTNITINPADHVSEMHFDSCANLQSVTLYNCNSCNVWAWPSPTTDVVATKKNCPRLNNNYVVNNYNTVAQYSFTNG